MTNLLRIKYSRIYLYQRDESHGNTLKKVRQFILSKLKSQSVCYSNASGSALHLNLNCQDNLTLDSIPASLGKVDDKSYKKFIENMKNLYIQSFAGELLFSKKKLESLSKREIAKTSILKALFSNQEYIIIDSPETFLTKEDIKLFKDSLKFEMENTNKTFILAPGVKDNFLDIATHIIKENEIKENILNSGSTDRNFQATYDFTLLNKQAN